MLTLKPHTLNSVDIFNVFCLPDFVFNVTIMVYGRYMEVTLWESILFLKILEK